MRKVLLALVVAAAVALGAAGGRASTARADNQGAEWLVAGTATILGFGAPMVHVNAQSNDGGANPRGHFWIRYPNGGPDFGGNHIICLSVSVNTASLVGAVEMIKTGGSGLMVGDFVRIRITDNGSPGTADLVNFDFFASTAQPNCSGVGDLPISQGNYVVHNQPVTDPVALLGLDQFIAQIESAANDPYG
jgi:hypothetical protein